MITIAEQILDYAKKLPEGEVLSAKALLHLGSRSSIDQALSRLHRCEDLLRISRGLYVLPVRTRFGTRAPHPEKVIAGIAAATGEEIVASGARAANGLGLSTHVPVRLVYLTSGRTRTIELGQQKVELLRAPHWQLTAPSRRAGEAIRALAWLGKEQAPRAAEQLKPRLSEEEREALMDARSRLPLWLAETVSNTFCETGRGANG